MLTEEKTQWCLKADLYRLLSQGFSYPDDAVLARIRHMILEIEEAGALPQPLARILGEIKGHLDPEELRREYSRLFMKGTVPMTETAAHPSYDVMNELASYYKAFGLTPKGGDTPDSLKYELEFMAILCLKTALATTQDHRIVAEEALTKFSRDHMTDFAQKFSRRLEEHESHPFYRTLTELILHLQASP